MKSITYREIPTAKRFLSDSSVTFAVRADDKILIHLDWLLERFHLHERKQDESLPQIILCEIFLSANYWIKSFKERNPRMKEGRYPAVLALFGAAVAQLGRLFRCSDREVARQIEEMFGRDLTPEGAKTDRKMQARMFKVDELALYRIRFRGGKAFHYGLEPTGPKRLAPLDTAPFFTEVARKGADGKMNRTNEGWGPFIMTLEREFYMAKHWLGTLGQSNVFHSAYTKGRPVSAAGTMLVEGGVIKGIRPDSGHYKPLEHNLVVALLALQMHGVPMRQLELQDYAGESFGTAHEFVKSRLTWQQYQAAGRLHQVQRMPAPPPGPGPAYAQTPPQVPGGAASRRPSYSQTPTADQSGPAYAPNPLR